MIDPNEGYNEYKEQQEKTGSITSKVQSKYILWLLIIAIIGYAIIIFGIGGDKKPYYIGFTILLGLAFWITAQSPETKPIPRNVHEAYSIAYNELNDMVQNMDKLPIYLTENLRPGEIAPFGSASVYPKPPEEPQWWRLGFAILDKQTKFPHYKVVEVLYYKGPVGITGIASLMVPYNGQEPSIIYVPVDTAKMRVFKANENIERLGEMPSQ